MTEREALKLALDAFGEIAWSNETQWQRDRAKEAITAIKEALAQSEHGWTPERIAGMARLKDAQNKKLAQPEHEPVAWYRDEDGIRIYYETKCWDDAIPLYTAPQRKPLSDEEIILIVADCASSHQHTDIHFARAIEQAHGIKELV